MKADDAANSEDATDEDAISRSSSSASSGLAFSGATVHGHRPPSGVADQRPSYPWALTATREGFRQLRERGIRTIAERKQFGAADFWEGNKTYLRRLASPEARRDLMAAIEAAPVPPVVQVE